MVKFVRSPAYTLVCGSASGAPILILPDGYAMYLRDVGDDTTGYVRAGAVRRGADYALNPRFDPTQLTDEEAALMMRTILTHA